MTRKQNFCTTFVSKVTVLNYQNVMEKEQAQYYLSKIKKVIIPCDIKPCILVKNLSNNSAEYAAAIFMVKE